MFSRIYQKFQSREGLTLAGSFALIVFSLVLIFGGAFHGPRGAYGQGDLPSTITVTGTGEAFAVPDIARFTFTVSKDAKTMNEAQKLASTQGNELVQKLKDAGIEAKDIKTEGFNAYPKYETVATSTGMMRPCGPDYCPPPYGGNQVIVGYTVSTTYSVKVRNLDKAGDIAQMITAANVSSVNGPDFTFDDPKVAEYEARGKAIADAKAQARVLARQLGVRLGRIVDFQVGGNGGIYPMYSMKAMSADSAEGAPAPAIEPGQTDVNVQVSITYKIH